MPSTNSLTQVSHLTHLGERIYSSTGRRAHALQASVTRGPVNGESPEGLDSSET